MFRFGKRMHEQAGRAPGTTVHIGERRVDKVRVTVFDYDESRVEERVVGSVEECIPYRDRPTVTWINVNGVHDVGVIEKLGDCFGIHPIAREDIANTGLRPKLQDYGDYLLVILKMIYFEPGHHGVKVEQVSLILGKNFVISFQENGSDVFDGVRGRIRSGAGRIRKSPADYLAYALLDAIVDGYFIVCERLGDEVELAQERLLGRPGTESLHTIQGLRGELIELRRSVWPLREVVASLERGESPLVTKDTAIFMRHVYDHTIEIIETLESFRDLVAGMIDIYLSSISVRLNEVMKVLTVIATIFIPLTFIVGVYGMNFHIMEPSLAWRYGFAAIMIVCAIVAGGMLVNFRRRGWL
jgi:magnesium transporter